jgi:hypothetical protein
MPGENPLEAARVVAEELPDFSYLAELPGRGPGADITGRAAGLLVGIPVELAGPRGWRIAERSGVDLRRARSLLSTDLDVMEEALDGYSGLVKVQLAGPWTLAATIEQPRSLKPALADPGLVADLAASLAEGAAAHVAEVGSSTSPPCQPCCTARCRRRVACPGSGRSKTRSRGSGCARCWPPRRITRWCIAVVTTSRSG